MITRPLADSRARRAITRGPEPLPLSMLRFFGGGSLWKRNGAAGLGGTAHFSTGTGHMVGNEPFNTNSFRVVSGCLSRFGASIAMGDSPSASASGCFR